MADTASVTFRPKTIDSYRWAIELHIGPEIGGVQLTQLRAFHLQALYRKKLEAGLSKLSVVKLHNVIKRILNQAVKYGLIVRNPADGAIPPKPDDKPLQTLRVDEFQALLAAGLKDHPVLPDLLHSYRMRTSRRRNFRTSETGCDSGSGNFTG